MHPGRSADCLQTKLDKFEQADLYITNNKCHEMRDSEAVVFLFFFRCNVASPQSGWIKTQVSATEEVGSALGQSVRDEIYLTLTPDITSVPSHMQRQCVIVLTVVEHCGPKPVVAGRIFHFAKFYSAPNATSTSRPSRVRSIPSVLPPNLE